MEDSQKDILDLLEKQEELTLLIAKLEEQNQKEAKDIARQEKAARKFKAEVLGVKRFLEEFPDATDYSKVQSQGLVNRKTPLRLLKWEVLPCRGQNARGETNGRSNILTGGNPRLTFADVSGLEPALRQVVAGEKDCFTLLYEFQKTRSTDKHSKAWRQRMVISCWIAIKKPKR